MSTRASYANAVQRNVAQQRVARQQRLNARQQRQANLPPPNPGNPPNPNPPNPNPPNPNPPNPNQNQHQIPPNPNPPNQPAVVQQPQNQMAQQQPAQEVWKSDPLQGDFNPGSKLGKDIFLEKTKGLPESERIPWTKANATRLLRYFRAREKHMHSCIDIPIEFNANGTVKKTANLLSQYRLITLTDCQRAAHGRYHNAIAATANIPAAPFQLKALDPANNQADKAQFYKKVASNVVAKIVENGVSVSSFEDLMLKKSAFMYQNPTSKEIEFDGPTMLFLILNKVDPETVVGLDTVEEKIETAKLSDFKNDVDAMLTDMETNQQILKDNHQPISETRYRKFVLKALQSGPNARFNEFIERIIGDTQSGIGAMAHYSADEIITAARTRYNNMDEQGVWDQVDPREAQIMALATEVQKMRDVHAKALASIADAPAAHATSTTRQDEDRAAFKERRTDDKYISGLPRWRATKTKGDKVEVNGKTYWWCPHHKHPDGHWDGLYVQHPPDKHKFKKGSGPGSNDSTAAPAAQTTAKLDLNAKLKDVLITNLCLSGDDVDKLFEQASEN